MTGMTGVLVSDTPSELLYGVALAGGILSAGALLLLVVTFSLRLQSERRIAQRARTRERWRKKLFDYALSEDSPIDELPSLDWRELPYFLELWLTLMQTLRGQPKERMVHLAERLELGPRLRAWLNSYLVSRQLTAMISLGYLGDRKSWADIRPYLDDQRTVFSLCAARALVASDAEKAAPLVLARLGRSDWSLDRITALLADIPASVRDPLLFSMIQNADEPLTLRLLALLDRLHKGGQAKAIALALDRFPESVEVLSQALHIMEQRRWLPLVRQHLEHPTWFVRMRAAQALGRLGSREDLPQLAPLLGDRHWWVRFRAAQAISHWPGMDAAALADLSASQADPFARDALNIVLTQRGVEPNAR